MKPLQNNWEIASLTSEGRGLWSLYRPEKRKAFEVKSARVFQLFSDPVFRHQNNLHVQTCANTTGNMYSRTSTTSCFIFTCPGIHLHVSTSAHMPTNKTWTYLETLMGRHPMELLTSLSWSPSLSSQNVHATWSIRPTPTTSKSCDCKWHFPSLLLQ
jgi:hypothetical protein